MERIELEDMDGLNEEEEISAWKIRELLRIKRDKEQREYRLVDDVDIERRRNMTDDQIASENKDDGKLDIEKKSLKFMQKYYHKGAFYAGNDEVDAAMARIDSSAPTLGDHADMTIMPDIMKVKNFGKRGRTKYTHLVDQDTTGVSEVTLTLVGCCLGETRKFK
jgi:microfibrillar-associated protein 1